MEQQTTVNEGRISEVTREAAVRRERSQFDSGFLFLTPRAQIVLSPSEVDAALHRHVRGDWGLLSPSEQQTESDRLQGGLAVRSIWVSERGFEFWLETEADRSMTTIGLGDDC